MENNLIKDIFTPKFAMIYKDSMIIFTSYSPYGLQKSIELKVTNGLGYRQIREPGKRIRSMSKLKEYLGEMEKSILINNALSWREYTFGFLEYINNMEKRHGKSRNEMNESAKRIEASLGDLKYRENHLEKVIDNQKKEIAKLKQKISKKRRSILDIFS